MQGCSHGELDGIYATIQQSEQSTGQKVDLLICCGDFQACRNENDLANMKVPKKFANMASYWEYYAGIKEAPVLTIFIGGNHEASNHLWELYYGGWVAPNIYYLGAAGVVNVGGLRIGGLSGIYKKFDYHKGHHEVPPFTKDEICTAYHVRSLEVLRCKSLTQHMDVFLTHDWPIGVYYYGDTDDLIRTKPFFEQEIQENTLGSPPAAEILEAVKPDYWFSGHLHVKFSALIPHENGQVTKFLALDKCLPRRHFIQVLDVGEQLDGPAELSYDAEWLACLVHTEHLYNPLNTDQAMPKEVTIPVELLEEVVERMETMVIPHNFDITAPPHQPGQPLPPYELYAHPQSEWFCNKLGIRNESVPEAAAGKVMNEGESFNISATSSTVNLNDTIASINALNALNASRQSLNTSNPADISYTQHDLLKQDESKEEANLSLAEFVAPSIPSDNNLLLTPSKRAREDVQCSTPVVLRHRISLPKPRADISPIKSKNEAISESIDNSISESVDKSVDIDEDFDLNETDDALLAKFMSLKKQFGRDQLSDSLIGNTSIRSLTEETEGKDESEEAKDVSL